MYGAVLNFLDDEVEKKGRSAAKAKALLTRMLDVKTIFGLRSIYYMVDQLSILSKVLQSRDMPFSDAIGAVEKTRALIEEEYMTGRDFNSQIWNQMLDFSKGADQCTTYSPLCYLVRPGTSSLTSGLFLFIPCKVAILLG